MEGYMGPCYAAGAMNPLGTAFNGVMNEASFQYAASGSAGNEAVSAKFRQ